MRKFLKNKKGFTLIELIVVIAILGILAGIAVPRFSGFQEKAKIGADKATMASVKTAVSTAIANGDISGSGKITITEGDTAAASYAAETGLTFKLNGSSSDVGTVMKDYLGQEPMNVQAGTKTKIVVTISSDAISSIVTE